MKLINTMLVGVFAFSMLFAQPPTGGQQPPPGGQGGFLSAPSFGRDLHVHICYVFMYATNIP